MTRHLSIFMMIYFFTCCAGGTDVGNGVKTTDMTETKLKENEIKPTSEEISTSSMGESTSGPDTETSKTIDLSSIEKVLVKVFGELCTDDFKILQQKGGYWTFNEDIISFEISNSVSTIKLNHKIILETKDISVPHRCFEKTADEKHNRTKIEVIKNDMGGIDVYVQNNDSINDEIEIKIDANKTYLLIHSEE